MSLAKWLPFKFDRKRAAAESSSSGPPAAAAAAAPVRVAPWPTEPLRAFQQLLDEPFLLDPFAGLGALGRWFGDHSPGRFLPRVDVVDRGAALEVTAELPGMTRDEIVLSIAEGALTLSGEKRVESSSTESGCYRVERSYGSFHRSIPLPSDVDRDRVDAVFADGVLKITLPKTDAGSGARKVPIR